MNAVRQIDHSGSGPGQPHELAPPRMATMDKWPGGGHRLDIELRHGACSFDRNKAELIGAAFAVATDEHILALVSPFWPWLQDAGDVAFLRDAVAMFLREAAFEDKHDRVHRHRMRLI